MKGKLYLIKNSENIKKFIHFKSITNTNEYVWKKGIKGAAWFYKKKAFLIAKTTTPIGEVIPMKKEDKVVITGIYKITSPVGSIYIGQSLDIYKRWDFYKKTICKPQNKLYNSLMKYGVENHVFEIIHECLDYELNELEVFYIKKFNSFNTKNGLNLREGGNHSKLSDESKKKLSDKKKGFKHTDEAKNKISKANKGRKHSAETLIKMSECKKGKKHSNESKIKIGNGRRNKKHTDESKKKMSESLKGKLSGEKNPNYGKKMSDEMKEKLWLSKVGVPVSLETRKKLSEATSGEKNPFFGKKHTQESKDKISKKHKGRVYSDEYKKKRSEMYSGEGNPNYGKKHTEETRKKMSIAVQKRIALSKLKKESK